MASSPDMALLLPALLLARTLGFVEFVPIAGAPDGPRLVKVALAMGLALLLFPLVPTPEITHWSALTAAMLLGAEVAVGVLFGVGVSLILELGRWVGGVADRVAGNADATSGPLTSLHHMLFLATFFAIGGHHLVFAAVADSLVAFPVAGPPVAHVQAEFPALLAHLTADYLSAAVLLAMPLLTATLLAELAFGFVRRVVLVPEKPIRSVLAVLVVLTGLGMVFEFLPGEAVAGLTGLSQVSEAASVR